MKNIEQLNPEKVSLVEQLYKNEEPIIIIFSNKTQIFIAVKNDNKEEEPKEITFDQPKEVQTEHKEQKKTFNRPREIQTYQRTNRIRENLRKFNISKNLWDEIIHIFNLMVEVFYKQNPTRKQFISPSQCIKFILIKINQQPEANKIPVLKFEKNQKIVDNLWESIKQMKL